MARARALIQILTRNTTTNLLSASGGATVTVYETDGSTPIAQTLYTTATGATVQGNPVTVDNDGLKEVWVETPQRAILSSGGETQHVEFLPTLDNVGGVGTVRVLGVNHGTSSSPVNVGDNQQTVRIVTYHQATSGRTFKQVQAYVIAESGTGGSIAALHGLAEHDSAGSWVSGGTYSMIGVHAESISRKAAGKALGLQVHARALTTASQTECAAAELTVDCQQTVTDRYGLSIVCTAESTQGGSADDIALRIVNKATAGTPGKQWANGIVFDAGDGSTTGFPVLSSGTLIRCEAGTVTSGIDLSAATITSDAFVGPNGARITGAGNLQLDNTKSLGIKESGGTVRALVTLTSGNVAQVGNGNVPLGLLGTQVGVFGVTPVSRAGAYTQTYATADKTHANPTSATLTDNSGGTGSTTLAVITGGGAGCENATKNAIASLAAQVNALRVDLLDAKELVNSVIDDLQAYGWAQ